MKITETLISFETAKLANKFGFPNLKTFPETEEHWKMANLQYTQALLQKWFRDIHSLHIEPHMYVDNGIYKYKYLIKSDFEDDLIIFNEEGGFSSYEKALEAGLVKGFQKKQD